MTGFLAIAREDADDARLLYQAGRYRACCSRAYYAMFNGARALLEARGYGPEAAKTHASVLRLVSLEFVQQGILDADHARALRIAERYRHAADYSRDPITAKTVRTVLEGVDPFLRAVEGIIDAKRLQNE